MNFQVGDLESDSNNQFNPPTFPIKIDPPTYHSAICIQPSSAQESALGKNDKTQEVDDMRKDTVTILNELMRAVTY